MPNHQHKVWKLARAVQSNGPLAHPLRQGSLPPQFYPIRNQIPTLMHGLTITFGHIWNSRDEIVAKRAYKPNVQYVPLWSRALNMSVITRVSTYALREIERVGGLDEYLCSVKEDFITDGNARMYRRKVLEALAGEKRVKEVVEKREKQLGHKLLRFPKQNQEGRLGSLTEEMVGLLRKNYGDEYIQKLEVYHNRLLPGQVEQKLALVTKKEKLSRPYVRKMVMPTWKTGFKNQLQRRGFKRKRFI
ncbi:39S ribosomal protein L24, mitochondrial [Rhizophlyctis rosea]|uniref:39S ribosomal protein L24, mitochondrial n=1 Tax=Rhizophlyctis rosea TaxID=64517 RepID=A0AAD5SD46_9FUNG|nr:39S ribosomal protein L24, mitochondrial [Rhizophlyctis rosea]